jgi:hypothetical protein
MTGTEEVWSYKVPSPYNGFAPSPLALSNDGSEVYAAFLNISGSPAVLFAFNSSTGEVNWQVTIPTPGNQGFAVYVDVIKCEITTPVI